MSKCVAAEEAVKIVKSVDRLCLKSAAAVPVLFVNALTDCAFELRNNAIIHLLRLIPM